jgi:hypothetical protein
LTRIGGNALARMSERMNRGSALRQPFSSRCSRCPIGIEVQESESHDRAEIRLRNVRDFRRWCRGNWRRSTRRALRIVGSLDCRSPHGCTIVPTRFCTFQQPFVAGLPNRDPQPLRRIPSGRLRWRHQAPVSRSAEVPRPGSSRKPYIILPQSDHWHKHKIEM